jgi:His-Xaa-Ser system protein HxsD
MTSEPAEECIEVEERLYPAEAVQAAAYAFTDRAYARIEPAAGGRLRVVLAFKPETTSAQRAAMEGELRNELLHQALRLKVSEANRKIREFIVTKALVSAQPDDQSVGGAGPDGSSAEPPCPDCAPAPAPVDPELEKEIDRLLAEIEGGDPAADPLGVAVSWEVKFGAADGPPEGKS